MDDDGASRLSEWPFVCFFSYFSTYPAGLALFVRSLPPCLLISMPWIGNTKPKAIMVERAATCLCGLSACSIRL